MLLELTVCAKLSRKQKFLVPIGTGFPPDDDSNVS